jgi:release factor glutamine methyltransferase
VDATVGLRRGYGRAVSSTTYDDVVRALRAAGCVFAEDEADLILDTAESPEQLAQMVRDRSAGRPLEVVLGWAEFCGLQIVVAPGVFVPRRRTEWLAAEAIALAQRPTGRRPVVLDLCCGAGALAAAVLAAVDAEVHAADIEALAVGCARINLGDDGRVHQGDLFEPLPEQLRQRVDVLVANVPYVPTGDIELLPPEARLHEPRVTLDGGPDGLDVARRVAAQAPAWLAPGGSVLIETSRRQVAAATTAFEAAGLTVRVSRCEDLDATVVIGTA